jgi:hypothetical protein
MAGGFNSYAAGSKVYGGGRSAPNIGPVSDTMGYRERDLKYKTRQRNNAILRRLQARQKGDFGSSANLSAPIGRTV